MVDRFYPSSKTCSGCGWVNEDLTLADRTFICKACGLVIDRDLNAAINLRTVAVSSIDTQNVYGEKSAGSFNGRSKTVLVEVGTNQHCSVSINV